MYSSFSSLGHLSTFDRVFTSPSCLYIYIQKHISNIRYIVLFLSLFLRELSLLVSPVLCRSLSLPHLKKVLKLAEYDEEVTNPIVKCIELQQILKIGFPLRSLCKWRQAPSPTER